MSENCRFVVVSTTVDSEDKAADLASKILDSRLAACVQRLPIKSTYRWKGAVENAEEVLLIAKTRTELAIRLTQFIKENHDYEVPEIVVSPVLGGHGPYLEWIGNETESA